MHWLKRGMWKAGIAIVGLMLFLVFMVWTPASSAGAYEGASGQTLSGLAQTAPTVDATATMTALNEEKLRQEIQQLKNQNGNQNNWLANNSTAIIAAITAIAVAFIGFTQWAGNRRDERRKEVVAQDKDLRAQAEERFKSAVTALGSENEATQVGGAILLRSFLNKDDEKIYGRYYTQIFDLAVAYLRLSNTSRPPEDPDGVPTSPEDLSDPLSLTPLRQALVIVFKESYRLARERLSQSPQFLDASCIQLDNAHLAEADLRQMWLPEASLRNAALRRADFSEASLYKAILSHADLEEAILTKTNLYKANLTDADLSSAHLSHANMKGANLSGAMLTAANFTGAALWAANLGGAVLREAKLTEADLHFACLERTTLDEADLREADFKGADLRGASLRGADLRAADLRGYSQEGYPGGFLPILLERANLSGADLTGAKVDRTSLSFLKDTNLRGVKGLTKEQLEACKARGAIIDEDTTASPPQSTVSPSPPSQGNNAQVPSALPAQVNTPLPQSEPQST